MGCSMLYRQLCEYQLKPCEWCVTVFLKFAAFLGMRQPESEEFAHEQRSWVAALYEVQ